MYAYFGTGGDLGPDPEVHAATEIVTDLVLDLGRGLGRDLETDPGPKVAAAKAQPGSVHCLHFSAMRWRSFISSGNVPCAAAVRQQLRR